MFLSKKLLAFTLLTNLQLGSAFADVGARVNLVAPHSFSPKLVEIRVNQTVEFTNNTTGIHTVTADPNLAQNPENIILPAGADKFNSGRLSPGQVFSHTFTLPGVYQYICRPHEGMGMIGRVVVR